MVANATSEVETLATSTALAAQLTRLLRPEGVALAFFVVLPFTLDFLLTFQMSALEPMITAGRPEVYSEAYVPVRHGPHTIGVGGTVDCHRGFGSNAGAR